MRLESNIVTNPPKGEYYVLQYRKGLSGFAHNPHTLIADFLQSDVTAVYFLALHAGRVAMAGGMHNHKRDAEHTQTAEHCGTLTARLAEESPQVSASSR